MTGKGKRQLMGEEKRKDKNNRKRGKGKEMDHKRRGKEKDLDNRRREKRWIMG